MNTLETQIKAALTHLGIKGIIQITPAGYRRYEVKLNGEYFGVFDIERNTFVD